MKVYIVDQSNNSVQPIQEVSFASQGLREVSNLEQWARAADSFFERKIYWIGCQHSATDSERSDLVGIDQDTDLILVEFKRGTVEIDALTQAFRYLPEYSSKDRDSLARLRLDSQQGFTKEENEGINLESIRTKMDAHVGGADEINTAQVLILMRRRFYSTNIVGLSVFK